MVKNDITINIGVIGVGHLGNFHLSQLKEIPQVNISGIYDNNSNRAQKMSLKHNVQSFATIKELLNKSDAVSIVTPTNSHYSVANEALNQDCHLFIEKPITDNIEHAELLLNKAK